MKLRVLWPCLSAGTGTGGTITGLGRRLKENNPNCLIVGVDPHCSVMGNGDSEENPGESGAVEGIGSEFLPTVLGEKVLPKSPVRVQLSQTVFQISVSHKRSSFHAIQVLNKVNRLTGYWTT